VDSRAEIVKPGGQGTGFRVEVSPERFSALFPFYFAVDNNLKFLGAGQVLLLLCPDIEIGKSLHQVFETLRPTTEVSHDDLYREQDEGCHHFFLFKHRVSHLQLRGGFMPGTGPGCHVFLGSPWLTDAEQLTEFGLEFADFAVHDHTVDMLQVFQASKATLADSKLLSSKLAKKSAQLQLANQQLHESERFTANTLDSLKSAIVILDERGGIISSNRAWTELAESRGLTAQETGVGSNYLEELMASRQAPPAATMLVTGIREVIAGLRPDFILEFNWHLPGRAQWFLCRASRFSGDGPVRIVVSHLDNTQLKALQDQQNRSQRMESLGTLAGGIAHDLNNALSPIIMGWEILRQEHPQQSQMLDIFQASVRRAADMVRQLLTFAKGAESTRAPLELSDLAREMHSIIKSTFPKNIAVQIALDPKLPKIMGDSTQLHQILLNLCVNARDAMPQGGKLTLEIKPVLVDEVYAAYQTDARPGLYVKLSVMDTGTGIPPDILNHIFEPFFTTKGPQKGTGLGLSTVLGIVKGHGGFIRAYSEVGKGSIFSVHLPVSSEVALPQRAVPPSLESCGHGETILLVDDEAPIREIGCAVLTNLGFNPLAATDGLEGLLLATEHRAQLSAVILDMDMPQMNGITLARALRRLRQDLPIAAMSGRFSEESQAELLEAGVTVQLAKPFTKALLAEVMKKLLATKARSANPAS